MAHLYRHYGKNNELLYVGISLSALRRLEQHKDHSHWFPLIEKVVIEHHPSREVALQQERVAIQDEKPKYNIHHRNQRIPEIPESQSEKSRWNLSRRIVNFNPMNTLQEASGLLRIGTTGIKRYMEEGKLGYVVVGSRRLITGWQIIDFIEYLVAHPDEMKVHQIRIQADEE